MVYKCSDDAGAIAVLARPLQIAATHRFTEGETGAT